MSSATFSAKAGSHPAMSAHARKRRLTSRILSLELEFEGKLNGSWSADLIQRTESAAADATRAEARGERARRLTEQTTGQCVRRRAEAVLIEQVERFGS